MLSQYDAIQIFKKSVPTFAITKRVQSALLLAKSSLDSGVLLKGVCMSMCVSSILACSHVASGIVSRWHSGGTRHRWEQVGRDRREVDKFEESVKSMRIDSAKSDCSSQRRFDG